MNLYRKVRKELWWLSIRRLARGPHITRYFMYDRLKAVGKRLPKRAGRVLAISRSANLVELLGLEPSEIVQADYPKYNILSLAFEDESFDFVLSDQVLEHIEGSPQQAIDECRRVLKPGGLSIHTTCFINPIHGSPSDFWRFTPAALSLLHRQFAEIIECDGWGNEDVWSVVRDGMRHKGVPHATWHPLHRIAMRNDPLWPIVTWVIARK